MKIQKEKKLLVQFKSIARQVNPVQVHSYIILHTQLQKFLNHLCITVTNMYT